MDEYVVRLRFRVKSPSPIAGLHAIGRRLSAIEVEDLMAKLGKPVILVSDDGDNVELTMNAYGFERVES